MVEKKKLEMMVQGKKQEPDEVLERLAAFMKIQSI